MGPLAYRLALPPELSRLHDVFHVSMLRRYRSDPSHVIQEPEVKISEDLTYQEQPIEILDRMIRKLRNKKIPMVKVKWGHHSSKKATWEVEKDMKEKYPYLFLNIGKQRISRTKFYKEGRIVTSSHASHTCIACTSYIFHSTFILLLEVHIIIPWVRP